MRAGTDVLGDLLRSHRADASTAFALQRLCDAVRRAHRWRTTLDGLPPSGPAVIVSNHLGYIDPIAVCSVTPCIPIAKSEVSQWPLVGSVARHYGVNFVRRGSECSGATALLRARRTLLSGASVLNFPEGTTTRGTMLPFKPGVFGLAALLDVPVVAVALRYCDTDLCWVDDQTFIHHYLRSLRREHTIIQLKFSSPMRAPAPGAALASRARELQQRAETWVRQSVTRARCPPAMNGSKQLCPVQGPC